MHWWHCARCPHLVLQGLWLLVQAAEGRQARYFLSHLPVLQKFVTPAVAAHIRCGCAHAWVPNAQCALFALRFGNRGSSMPRLL